MKSRPTAPTVCPKPRRAKSSNLRLQRLTGLEREKIAEELTEIGAQIIDLLDILRSMERKFGIARAELISVKERFADKRRTTIEDLEFESDVEALIQREDMVVTVSVNGAIKRVPVSAYRAQRRGGRGRAGMAIRDEDFVSQVFVASTHAPVLFFTSSGRVYKIKVWRLPLGTPQARGKAFINLLPNVAPGEGISAILPLPEDEVSWADLTVMFATSKGYVRRNSLGDFANVMANGKIAMKFEGEDADDTLIGVASCSDAQDVLLATRNGRCIRFPVTDVRVFTGRSSVGVRGIRLLGDDKVISMSILDHIEVEHRRARRLFSASPASAGARAVPNPMRQSRRRWPMPPRMTVANCRRAASRARSTRRASPSWTAQEEFLLSVTSKGFGVRTSAYRFRITEPWRPGHRLNMNLEKRDDAVVAVFPVQDGDEIVLVTNQGQVIRCPVHDIRIAGRGTAGVVVFRVSAEEERVVSVATLRDAGEGEGEGDERRRHAGGPESGGVPPDSTVH